MLAKYSVGTKLLLAAIVLGLGQFAFSPSAQAATANPGITVTPAKLTFLLSKDAPSQKIDVTITNNYDSPLNLAAELKGIDDNAGLLVPSDTVDASFVEALVLSETNLTLAPHAARTLTVQLNNTAALAPGGHYATIVLTQQAENARSVSLRAAISLTVFGIKTEGAQQAFDLTTSTNNHWIFRLPSTATLTYRNTGNVHVVPRASVFIPQPRTSEPLLQGISNANSLPVLPGKTLTDTVALQKLGSVWLPRHLQVVISYRSDGQEVPRILVQQFWYIPPAYPLVLVFGGIALWQYRRRKQTAKIALPSVVPTHSTPPQIFEPAKPLPVIEPKKPSKKTSSKPKTTKKRAKRTHKPVVVTPESLNESVTAPKPASKTPTRKVPVKDAKPLITLQDLTQRTTKITPKSPKPAAFKLKKKPAPSRKKSTTKPRPKKSAK